ncbi:MAG: hypothetical protein JSW52_10845 [Candidatus Coatesbacteria bacterium]|nr:MAG: hypothetical protein JSW52_10845 [Candidatus Coatesbacteria bacterium]
MRAIRVMAIFLSTLSITSQADAEAGEVVELNHGFQFEEPGSEWTVKKYDSALVLAGLERENSEAVITITYFDYTIYDDINVDYGYLRGLLVKNEKSTYKATKPNYERVNLDKVILSTGDAARLEFTTEIANDKRRSVVTCLNSGKLVFFVSMESREEEFDEVISDYKALLSSIVVK